MKLFFSLSAILATASLAFASTRDAEIVDSVRLILVLMTMSFR